MVDTWWFEAAKRLVALWRDEAVQHELNTMHNKKLEWEKISQEMTDGGYLRIVYSVVAVSDNVFFFFWPSKLPLSFFWPPHQVLR